MIRRLVTHLRALLRTPIPQGRSDSNTGRGRVDVPRNESRVRRRRQGFTHRAANQVPPRSRSP